MRKNSIVLVEYVDSSSIFGWHRFSNDDSIAHCVVVGIVKDEDDNQIVFIMGKSDSGNVDTTLAIPKVSIKRIRQLRIGGGKNVETSRMERRLQG